MVACSETTAVLIVVLMSAVSVAPGGFGISSSRIDGRDRFLWRRCRSGVRSVGLKPFGHVVGLDHLSRAIADWRFLGLRQGRERCEQRECERF
jgi:hypothetical protein